MKKIFLILIASLLYISSTFAQSNTYYFNTKIFQSTMLNPARQHTCKFSMGLPALSTIYANVKHQGLTYADLFTPLSNNPDSFYVNLDNIYNKMPDISYLTNNEKISLGYLAFWINDFYVTLDANINVGVTFGYPKSILNIKNGNYFTDNRFISLTGLSINTNIYVENSLGISKEIIPNLVVGVRLKYLTGLAYTDFNMGLDWHVSTADSSIYDYSFQNIAYNLKYAGPININTPVSSNGIPDFQNFGIDTSFFNSFSNINDFKTAMTELKSIVPLTKNHGIAIDLGVTYKIFDKIELSASILDLGYINWKVNPLSISKNDGRFDFSGLDAGKYLDTASVFSLLDGNFSLIDTVQNDFVDSLLTITKPTIDTTNSFRTPLNTTMIFAASFSPVNWFTIGAMYRGLFYNKKIISAYSVSGTIEFWKGWSLMMSYTSFNKSSNNIGLGFSAKLMPFQFYMLMDNIALPLFGLRYATSPDELPNKGIATNLVKNMSMFNIQIGFNFMLGCRKQLDYGLID